MNPSRETESAEPEGESIEVSLERDTVKGWMPFVCPSQREFLDEGRIFKPEKVEESINSPAGKNLKTHPELAAQAQELYLDILAEKNQDPERVERRKGAAELGQKLAEVPKPIVEVQHELEKSFQPGKIGSYERLDNALRIAINNYAHGMEERLETLQKQGSLGETGEQMLKALAVLREKEDKARGRMKKHGAFLLGQIRLSRSRIIEAAESLMEMTAAVDEGFDGTEKETVGTYLLDQAAREIAAVPDQQRRFHEENLKPEYKK